MLDKLKSADQKLSPGFRKIIRNIGWLSAERLIRMALSFIVGVYVIRYLGPEQFGKLSYSTSFVFLFLAITKLGLDEIVVRNLVKQEDTSAKILGTAFVLKLIGCVLAFFIVSAGIIISTDDWLVRWMTIIIAFSMIFTCFDILDLWFQSQVLSKSIAIVRSIQFAISSLAKLGFIWFHLPLISFAYLFVADTIIRAIGMTWVYLKDQQQLVGRWQLDKSIAVDLLLNSWPLILSGAMVTINMNIDQVMLGNMSTSEELGNYAAAVKFSEVWYFIPTVICSSVFPAIVQAKQQSRVEYYAKMQRLYDFMSFLSLSIALAVAFTSKNVLTNLLGAEYSSAGTILLLHIWSGIFIFFGVARGNWLVIEDMTRLSLITQLMGAVTNVVLNLFLIKQSGAIGAAIATLISYAVSSYLSCMIFPAMHQTGWMLTKALLIPFRFKSLLPSSK
ncbi:MAG: flippase [Pleurocapsa minor HA4230-MV1]|jgi:O-antigen/teichoic acid export membrane protein|nr:flippase [Pleurocapsa minor HA4230-MV1]